MPGGSRWGGTTCTPTLNTYRPGALDEAWAPAAAQALRDRCACVSTPRQGSWPHIAEVELSVLIRQGLPRRSASLAVLRAEVAAWQAARDRLRGRVNGPFTTADARVSRKRLYPPFNE